VESAKVLLRYLDKNPARLSEAGITLAIEALRDAWPCAGDDAAAPSTVSAPKPKKHVAKKPTKRPVQAPASVKPAATQ